MCLDIMRRHSHRALNPIKVSKIVLLCKKLGFGPSKNGQNGPMWRQNGDKRFPNAEGKPQRNMATSEDYERFFQACDQAVLFANPDRVIKAGDGDYDPPSPGLPDNHCYNGWYNGHGLGLGEMHKGYWQPVKPDWYYACGEFGAEGLDPVNTMLRYYPQDWLPRNQDPQGPWTAEEAGSSSIF